MSNYKLANHTQETIHSNKCSFQVALKTRMISRRLEISLRLEFSSPFM